MTSWIVLANLGKGLGGPLYMPPDPYGIPGDLDYPWAPWTPLKEFSKKFESKEEAEAFMVALTMEGFDFGNGITYEAREA
jgi:hypothetical protein